MTETTNFKFNIVDFEQIPWQEDEHDNWYLADAILATYIRVTNIVGVWKNATVVAVGERYVDSSSGAIYTVNIAHTTASTGTFEADRTTNPTYWNVFSDADLAESWASYLGGLVENTDYSAKAYAIGTSAQLSAGSAKRWATEVEDTVVTGTSYSALHYAAKAAADAVLTAADRVATAADVVSTNADVVSTNADVVTTGNNVTAAQAAQTAAEAAQTAAELAADTFDDTYLGAKSSAPTLDNDGDPLSDGDLYFDTTLNAMRVYDLGNTTWVTINNENVKVSSNDTTEGYLNGKLVAGTSITLTENSDGGNETLTIASTGAGLGMVLALGG